MDFILSADTEDYRKRVRAFVDAEIIPLEGDRANYDAHGNIAEGPLTAVRAKARAAGLWAPQMPEARGGLGLTMTGQAMCYEEASRSIFGASAFNCAAPDDGNMRLLEKVGTDEQKARWLQPIIDGKVNSAFAMTEPHPGSGSDPGSRPL